LLTVRRRGSCPFLPLPRAPMPRADLGEPAPSCLYRGRIWADPASAAGRRSPPSTPACCARLPSSAVVRLLHATNSRCRGEDLCNCHRPDNHAANSLQIWICVCCALPRRHLRRAPVAAIAGRLSNSSSTTRTSINSSNSGCCQLRFLWFVWFPVSYSS
jgi:hypothetical protein